jgi:hypothetical protein
LNKTLHKNGLAEWVKVKALSPNPSMGEGEEKKMDALSIASLT